MWRRQEKLGVRLTGLGGDPADWARFPELLHSDGTLELTMGGYLAMGFGRLVLVDAGVGPEPLGPLTGGELPARLRAAGFEPQEVTDVVFTHIHGDHVGWASLNDRPYFSRATYRCHSAEVGHARATHGFGRLEPAIDRLETFDSDITLAPGLDVRLSEGHTPGSCTAIFSGMGTKLLLMGDAVHCVHELLEPQWDGIIDHDPVRAKQTRQSLALELERTGAYGAGGHFPGLQFGRLLSVAERKWTFERM
jgi:glyoxylase-like metal-dependent hydrolase (beta-lactamase superfamily II)